MAANLLSANQSSVETDLAGFQAVACSTQRDLSISAHGAASLKVTVSLAQETQNGYAGPASIGLLPSTTYTWQVYFYVPVSTTIRRAGFFFQSQTPPYRQVGFVSTPTSILYAAGWHLLTGTGTTTSDWGLSTILQLRPPRKDDDSAFDSTKAIYYDKLMVEEGPTASTWVLGGQDYNALTLAPDAILSQTNLTGAVTNIDDNPEEADGLWLVS